MELMTRKDDETLRDWWFKLFKKQHIGFLTAKYLRKGSGERPLNKCLDRPQQKGDTFQCDLLWYHDEYCSWCMWGTPHSWTHPCCWFCHSYSSPSNVGDLMSCHLQPADQDVLHITHFPVWIQIEGGLTQGNVDTSQMNGASTRQVLMRDLDQNHVQKMELEFPRIRSDGWLQSCLLCSIPKNINMAKSQSQLPFICFFSRGWLNQQATQLDDSFQIVSSRSP